MSGNPDSSDPEDVSEADTAFGELLAQVARGPQPSLLPEGAMVGEYRVVRQLGRGAFGAVYHATHVVIGKQVALKVLGSQFSEDAAMAARFVDEARAVNRIAHPNIVDIFGFGSLPDGRKYCVMELLTGETLGACLERRGHLPLAEATEILTQVASALDAAHKSGIVHRDLKPDNIFLCRAPESADDGTPASKVKLLDFGIAQIADGLHMRTGSNMMLGTPGYMSPEQCKGARIDFRSDIYALGVVSFELLTGSLPFQGTNAFQVTSKHLTLPAPAPSERRSELSAQVDSAVLRMLSKSPEERPDTATQAVRALSGSVSLPPISTTAAAVSSAIPASAPATRRFMPFAAALTLVVMVVLLGTRFFAPDRKSEGPEALLSGQAAANPAPATSTPGPTSSPSPASPASPAAPASPATVRLRVEGQPASARVFLGKDELGRLGDALSLPRSETALSLSVKAPGFVRRDLIVTPSRDQVLEVKLVPAARRRNPELEY
jgi:eukaryotic-like serine/threonine-protein kinase